MKTTWEKIQFSSLLLVPIKGLFRSTKLGHFQVYQRGRRLFFRYSWQKAGV